MLPQIMSMRLHARRTRLCLSSLRATQPLIACSAIAVATLLFPLRLPAQTQAIANPQPEATVEVDGHLQGDDISVDNGPGSASGQTGGISVANGSVVVVHSGHARLTLTAGGEIDICGPAKFTFLDTNGSITIAIDFGRIRTLLPNDLPLKVYTPLVAATPLSISGGTRDFTIGLAFSDAICVRATEGAIRLEEQFTGQDMIVPKAGEFFISGGTLAPVAGPPGGCQCDFAESAGQVQAQPSVGLAAPPTPANPESAQSSRPRPRTIKAEPTPDATGIPDVPLNAEVAPATPGHWPAPLQPPSSPVELSVPAAAKNAAAQPPRAPKPQAAVTPNAPPADEPVWTAVMPPLRYTAGQPAPPPAPSPQTILLVREVRVQPGWRFTGQVVGLPSAHSKPGSTNPAQSAQGASVSSNVPTQHHGFWSKVRKVLLFGA
jgi:hypothetical protein